MAEGTTVEGRASFPAGARCAHHPDRQAQRTCVRCGNYMCAECISTNSEGTCLTCASRFGLAGAFPYSRDQYSFDGLLNLSLSRWKANWLPLAFAQALTFLCAYVPIIVSMVPTFMAARANAQAPGASAASYVGQAIGIVLQSASQLVLFGYCLDLLEQKPGGLARALERVRALPAMLLQLLLIYGSAGLCAAFAYGLFHFVQRVASPQAGFLAVGLFVLALVPFFVYASIGVAFTSFELAYNSEATAISALITSWNLVSGKRWSAASIMFLAGLLAGVGMFACCVGVLASGPLASLIFAGLFLALRQPTDTSARAHSPEWPV
jgi:hypothetical protein